ncbi:MAG: hypothetical protein H0Z35_10385 [Thermoanaerobacteraceae bacterium]|nr:hypothetical protein [Thermoanaerobacteraceae bacterium]
MKEKDYDRYRQKAAQGLTPELTRDLEAPVLADVKQRKDQTYAKNLTRLSEQQEDYFSNRLEQKTD